MSRREDLIGKYPLLKRGSFSKQEQKPKVKIEAPLHDLADLIHGAITGDHEQIDVQDTPNAAPTYQAPIEENLPQLNTSALSEEDSSGYEPTNLSSSMQTSQVAQPESQNVFDRLKDTLRSAPIASEYHPSKLRKVGGAIVGGLTGAAYGPEKGREAAENIVQAPYRESYQDWLTKSGALEKEANIETTQRKAGQEDYKNYLDYLGVSRNILKDENEIDPNVQGILAKAKKKGEEEALKPGREDADARELNNKIVLESLVTQREKDIEEIRQKGRIALSDKEQKQKDKEIKSREKLAADAIKSRENIAKLKRELDAKIAGAKNQRVPPNQQAYAQVLAENEVSKTIASSDELEQFFDVVKDKDGNTASYKLKPISAFKNPKDKTRYEEVKSRIDNIKKNILKSSFSSNDVSIDEDDNDDISIEEL